MRKRHLGSLSISVLVAITMLPSTAAAQSAIAGLVTDTTGGVLPGVTVEVESPVLIERVRAVVTDNQGRYTVVDLRPGVYTVTFTLPGFSTVVRDGVQLPASFTATVNAELRVGAVEETVTVSGQAPVVDVHSSPRTEVLPREVIDNLPTGRGYRSVGLLLPGVEPSGRPRPMVGDISVPPTLATQGGTSWDMTQQIDGVMVTTLHSSTYQPYNDALIEESTYQTSALPAETSRGGVRVNLIPRDGGNTLRGGATFIFSDGSWQTDNLDQELIARGVRQPNRLYHSFDINPWMSGPIKRDRLWFFSSSRYQEHQQLAASTAQGGGYGPGGGHITNHTTRLNWQVAPKHKFIVLADYTGRHNPIGFIGDPAANYRPDSMYYGPAVLKWSSTMTSRLLFEGGYSWNAMGYTKRYLDAHGDFHYHGPARGTPEWNASATRRDIGTGIDRVAGGAGIGAFLPIMQHVSASMSYVTGSHSVKIGLQHTFGSIQDHAQWNADLIQIYVNGIPRFVDILNSPTDSRNRLDADLGVYVQDSWTIGRLTVNPGVRFDHFSASIEATSSPAGRFMPARSFARVPNLPEYNDVVPRFGMAYDVFGDGRTAIKASVSKYLAGMGLGNPGGTRNYDPTAPIASSAGAAPTPDRRDWNDRDLLGRDLPTNGDDVAQETEIGPSNNLNYGLKAPRRLDPNVSREYSIEYTASIQREIVPGLSAALFYQHRPYRNLLASKNEAVGLSDYTPFQLANPMNPSEQITIYNLNRGKQGQVDLLDTTSDINRRTYTGIHLVVDARLRGGSTLVGTWSAERTVNVTCDTNDPNELRFCDPDGKLYQELGATPKPPFASVFKFLGTFAGLPYDFTGSVALRSYLGDEKAANWIVPASLFPNGQRTQPVTMRLIPRGTEFLPRWTQVDVSVKRTFRIGGATLVADVTVFNVINANTVITQTSTFGPSLWTPTSIIPGRLPRIGLQMTF